MDKDDKKKTGLQSLLGNLTKSEDSPSSASDRPKSVPSANKKESEPLKTDSKVLPGKAKSSPPPVSSGSAGATAKEKSSETKTKPKPKEVKQMNEEEITNHISADLSDQDKKEIYDAIDVIRRKLSFAKDFSEEEKESLMHLGKTGRKFVEKAQNLVESAPGILPRSFDVDEFHRDAELYHELSQISREMKKLTERISDTEAAVGSDAFTASLVVYQSGKLARTGDDMDNLLTGWRRGVTDALHD